MGKYKSPVRKSLPSAAIISLIPVLALLIASTPPTYAQLEDLVARVKQATVLIEVRDVLGNQGHGSGFVYGPSGYILTNHHVVEGKIDISVKLPDGRSFPARVVDYLRSEEYSDSGLQSDIDVAVLKIDAVKLPTLLLEGASVTLQQGQDLLVLGYPGGVGTDQVSVTRGIVSAVRTGWIQTDAAIEPGNSGGPVVDRQGRVVGLATFITGPLGRIGGVVAMSGIRDFAFSALDPNAQRRKEVAIPGLEYISPVVFPKRRTYRITYDPGTSRGQPYVREFDATVTGMQDINGAYIYIAHISSGADFKYYVDTDGAFTVNEWDPNWSYSYPKPFLIFPLPPRVGRSWEGEYSGENSSQGMRLTSTSEFRIDSDGEVISTPAGTFPHSIKVVVEERRIVSRGSQSNLFHSTQTFWRAPNIGLIRVINDVLETREHIIQVLMSSQ